MNPRQDEEPNKLLDERCADAITHESPRTSEIIEESPERSDSGGEDSRERREIARFYVAVETYRDREKRTDKALRWIAEECGGVTVQDAVGCWMEDNTPSKPERTKVFTVVLKPDLFPSVFKILGEVFDAEKVILVDRDGRPEDIRNLYGLIRRQISEGLIDELTAKGLLPQDFKLAPIGPTPRS